MKKNPIKVEYKTLVVLWAALLMSQVLFLVLAFTIKPELFRLDLTRSFFDDQPLVILVFAAGAVALFILSFVLRNQHITRAVVDRDAGCVQTALVLGCALCEGISLVGLILALVFEYPYFFLWIGLATLGILFHFPRKGNLRAAADKRLE